MGGEFTKTQYRDEDCLEKGGRLGQFTDLRGGGWQERGGGVFEGGLIPRCTLWVKTCFLWNF